MFSKLKPPFTTLVNTNQYQLTADFVQPLFWKPAPIFDTDPVLPITIKYTGNCIAWTHSASIYAQQTTIVWMEGSPQQARHQSQWPYFHSVAVTWCSHTHTHSYFSCPVGELMKCTLRQVWPWMSLLPLHVAVGRGQFTGDISRKWWSHNSPTATRFPNSPASCSTIVHTQLLTVTGIVDFVHRPQF
jgi:hypothetical protein